MDTRDIIGVEIFASGTWNGDTYTDGDLDEMVNNFRATKDALKPYLKLGHDDGQKLMPQKDGMPSLGWIENLRRVGKKLVADFKGIPGKIHDLIKAGGYRRVSSEIYLDAKIGGKTFGKVLKAVALLGGDTPAVQNLKDILSLYGLGSIEAHAEIAGIRCYEVEAGDLLKEDDKMKTAEQLQAELSETTKKLEEAKAEIKKYTERDSKDRESLEAKVKEYSDKNADLQKQIDALKKDKDDLSAQVGKFQTEAITAKVTADVNKLIEEKHILPAQKEKTFALLMDAAKAPAEKKFKDGDKELSAYDHMLAFMQASRVDVSTEEASQTGERQSADLDAKIQAFIAKEKKEGREVSYKDAMLAVSEKEQEKK